MMSLEWAYFGAALGSAFIVIGGAVGIAIIGNSALTNMARQPSSSNNLRIAMIILAALIEGITLFALVVCLLIVIFVNNK